MKTLFTAVALLCVFAGSAANAGADASVHESIMTTWCRVSPHAYMLPSAVGGNCSDPEKLHVSDNTIEYFTGVCQIKKVTANYKTEEFTFVALCNVEVCVWTETFRLKRYKHNLIWKTIRKSKEACSE